MENLQGRLVRIITDFRTQARPLLWGVCGLVVVRSLGGLAGGADVWAGFPSGGAPPACPGLTRPAVVSTLPAICPSCPPRPAPPRPAPPRAAQMCLQQGCNTILRHDCVVLANRLYR